MLLGWVKLRVAHDSAAQPSVQVPLFHTNYPNIKKKKCDEGAVARPKLAGEK
jgi:hypothetical protein